MSHRQHYADSIAAALRPMAPNGKLFSEEVGLINQIASLWEKRTSARDVLKLKHETALHDAEAFWRSLRASKLFGGHIEQQQVDGTQVILKAVGAASWPIAWAAYALATAAWETKYTMQPVLEAFWLSEDWRKKNLRYWPHYGRGYVQLTWSQNYERADRELGLGGKLIENLDLALDPDIAALILVRGMAGGWFNTHKLADHLPIGGPASRAQFREARRIINGTDKADAIAGLALTFQKALKEGKWK